jgi:hypothetical protein
MEDNIFSLFNQLYYNNAFYFFTKKHPEILIIVYILLN